MMLNVVDAAKIRKIYPQQYFFDFFVFISMDFLLLQPQKLLNY